MPKKTMLPNQPVLNQLPAVNMQPTDWIKVSMMFLVVWLIVGDFDTIADSVTRESVIDFSQALNCSTQYVSKCQDIKSR